MDHSNSSGSARAWVLRRRHDTRAAASEPRSWSWRVSEASSEDAKHILRSAVSRATTSPVRPDDADAARGRQVFLRVHATLGPAPYVFIRISVFRFHAFGALSPES